MAEQIDIDINVNMENVDEVDDLTAKLQEATSEVERLEDALDEAHMNGDDIGADVIADELADARAEAEALADELQGIDAEVEFEFNTDEGEEELEEFDEKLNDTRDTATNLTTALSGIAGIMGIDEMISTADRINTSWNQLKLTFNSTGVSLDELKLKTGQAADATGLSGGQVRGYFNSMGIAGIKNTNLLSSSFQSLAGKAYQTGDSVEVMESKVQQMVMTGNAGSRMLKALGLTTEDLAKAMGVSADEAKDAFEALSPEGRLEAITKAMGDGTAANEMYKNSYAGLKQQAETAMSGLMGAIGQGILPVINPMIQSATGFVKDFTNSFKSLPGPIQAVVGGLGGFMAAGTAVVGTLGLVGQVGKGVVDGLKSMKSGYDTVKDAIGTARDALNALRNAESITQGIRAALAVVTGAESAAEGANAAAKTAATGPTMGLAIAENSLLLPILLVVGAVIAVIAVMWYLYNTNETVRNGINWLIAQIQGFINMLIPAAQSILRFVTTTITNIGQLPGRIWGLLLQAVTYVSQWAANMVSRGVQAAHNFVNSVSSAISGVTGAISSALSGVFNAITAPFRQAYDFVNNNVIKPLQDAWNTVTSFGDFTGYGSFDEGYGGVTDTLNSSISSITSSNSTSNMTVNNNFNGIVEESAADYIINTVNDRLRKEKLLRGA